MKKTPHLIILAMLFAFALAHSLNAQQSFYVSPVGSDHNPGTLDKPFGTIARARDAVRQVNRDMKEDIVVNLRGGTHWLKETVEFDARDSGAGGHRVVYQAYQDETPVISGGIQITGWTPHKNGVWKALAKGINFRQIYVNGVRGIRARTPNVGEYYQGLMWDVKAREILVDGQRIRQWQNFKQVEMIVHMNWAEAIMRLDSFTTSSERGDLWHSPMHARIRVQEPERHLVFARDYPPKRNENAWHLENAMEFLDTPGEWYLDRAAQALYYMPRAGEDMSLMEAIVPQLETLLAVRGTLDQPVRNLGFKGITFRHSTWLRPSERGALNIQACNYTIDPTKEDFQFVERCAAAVYVAAAQGCVFEGNVFEKLGASGLDLHFGTKNCVVNGNLFRNIAASGIQVAKFSDPDVEMHIPYLPKDEREICENDRIENNRIACAGQDYAGAIGIACGFPRGIVIARNEISNLPYTGISVGWGWRALPNAMRDNVIKQNHIHHVCQIMCDGGGIYTLSSQPGSQIVENYIHNVEHASFAGDTMNSAIYLDEGSTGFLIENNVLRNVADRKEAALKGESVYKNNNLALPEVMKNAGPVPEFRDRFARLLAKEDQTMKLKHVVMMTELKNEAEAIEKYRHYHSAEGVWPEVVYAAKISGIQSLKIYLHGNRLVMIISIPEDLTMDEMNRRYAASSARIKEWGEIMSGFQQAPPGAKKDEVWVPMELIHDYENGNVK
jgi:L-rhamnose mutarotase